MILTLKNRVSKNDLAGTVTEIDEAGTIRVKWDLESEGATWEQENDLTILLDDAGDVQSAPDVTPSEAKPKKARKTKQNSDRLVVLKEALAEPVNVGTNLADQVTAEGNGINPKETAPESVSVATGTQVKLTGRIRNEVSKNFVTDLGGAGDFTLVEDRTYQAARDVTKSAWKHIVKSAKKAGLALEIVEVKEPAKRLTKREREIKAKRLSQLAEARKNLAAARKAGTIVRKPKAAPVSPESVVDASVSVDPTTEVTAETVNDNERVDQAA